MPYKAHHDFPMFRFRTPLKQDDGTTLWTADWYEKGPNDDPRLLCPLQGEPGAWVIPLSLRDFKGKKFGTRHQACQNYLDLARWDGGIEANLEWVQEFLMGSPQRDLVPMKESEAQAAFDILVEEVMASEDDRDDFVYSYVYDWTGGESKYRFGGCLGHGGMFHTARDHWFVDGHEKDLTSYRRSCASNANVRLGQLWIKNYGHPLIPVHPDW